MCNNTTWPNLSGFFHPCSNHLVVGSKSQKSLFDRIATVFPSRLEEIFNHADIISQQGYRRCLITFMSPQKNGELAKVITSAKKIDENSNVFIKDDSFSVTLDNGEILSGFKDPNCIIFPDGTTGYELNVFIA